MVLSHREMRTATQSQTVTELWGEMKWKQAGQGQLEGQLWRDQAGSPDFQVTDQKEMREEAAWLSGGIKSKASAKSL